MTDNQSTWGNYYPLEVIDTLAEGKHFLLIVLFFKPFKMKCGLKDKDQGRPSFTYHFYFYLFIFFVYGTKSTGGRRFKFGGSCEQEAALPDLFLIQTYRSRLKIDNDVTLQRFNRMKKKKTHKFVA